RPRLRLCLHRRGSRLPASGIRLGRRLADAGHRVPALVRRDAARPARHIPRPARPLRRGQAGGHRAVGRRRAPGARAPAERQHAGHRPGHGRPGQLHPHPGPRLPAHPAHLLLRHPRRGHRPRPDHRGRDDRPLRPPPRHRGHQGLRSRHPDRSPGARRPAHPGRRRTRRRAARPPELDRPLPTCPSQRNPPRRDRPASPLTSPGRAAACPRAAYARNVTQAASSRPRASDRATVERTVRDLILGVVEQRVPAGTSIVLEGAPGIGKTFLARAIVDAIEPGAASIRRVVGLPGRRNDPFGVAGALLGDVPCDPDPGDAAFDRVDELCADGPVVLWVDDAHHLDAASLTLLRRLAWASRDLPLVLLVSARPYPAREPLAMLVRQAQVRLRLPPMGPMMTERLVYDHTGRWPGPVLRRVLDLAAGNPLFATELLGTYERAGALAEAGPDSVDARFELDLRATGLTEVVRAHLGQLDQPTRDMLAVMSVWGTGISVDDLARLLPGQPGDGRPPPPDDLLERAIASGLIRREPAGTVGFSHDLFREVTYAGLAEPRRRALHRQVAGLLAAAGYRPTLVADHLLRAAGPGGDPVLAAALHEAVTATRGYAPEVTADLLDDVAALGGAEVTGRLLLDRADALFHRGRGESAEALIRERIATVTDPGVAAQMQLLLIRSLMNRADIPAALAALDRTIAIPA